MIEFFTGMRFLDIFTCCVALLITVTAVFGMCYIYIYERRKAWQKEHTGSTK